MLDVQHTRGPMRLSSSACIMCGGRMQLVAVTPQPAPSKELRLFKCVDCDETQTVEISLPNPGEAWAEAH